MKIEIWDKLIFLTIGILIGSLVILILMSNWFYQIPYSIQFKVHGYTQENALAVCSGKDLERTALCLNAFVKKIYKYRRTKDGENLNFEKIIELGHDCQGYTFIYQTLFSKLGFKTQEVRIDVSRENNILHRHVWIVAYDETGWCSLDQRDINCFMYK